MYTLALVDGFIHELLRVIFEVVIFGYGMYLTYKNKSKKEIIEKIVVEKEGAVKTRDHEINELKIRSVLKDERIEELELENRQLKERLDQNQKHTDRRKAMMRDMENKDSN